MIVNTYDSYTLTWFIDCPTSQYQAFYGKESPLFHLGASFRFVYQPFGCVEVCCFVDFDIEDEDEQLI